MKFELKTSADLQDYPSSLAFMEERVQRILKGEALPLLWFLEYPPLFTQGRSSKETLSSLSFPVFGSNRGGKTTYHGPGQRVLYVMLDLALYGKDVKLFVSFLEEWAIETLAEFGVTGKRAQNRTGVWVETQAGEKKIAALGVRLHKGVTSHGLSLNVSPDLTPYTEIIPCGIQDYGVTSLKDLGVNVSLETVDQVLLKTVPFVFQRIMEGSIDGYCKN